MRASVVLCVLALLAPGTGLACGLVSDAGRIWRAGTAAESLTVTFLGHASFLIETPDGVRAVTDYNGRNIPELPPDVATMNHAHTTHYTDHPDPRIGLVLHGWQDGGGPAHVDASLRDLHVRNVPTNIRGEGGGTEYYGNSIFVFESAGLCVAHLGHLHHLLTPEDLAAIGPVDVVMAPVDGYWTLSHEDMATVLDQLRAPLVLPMHYFTTDVLDRFLDLERGRYDIRISPTPTTVLSAATIPAHPTILVLPGGY